MARSVPVAGRGAFDGACLSAEQERDLFTQWRSSGDERALARIVGAHRRLSVKIAWQHAGYGVPVDDLIQEGCAGIMKAAHKYDLGLGWRFSTYAQQWITAEIREAVMRSASLVKFGTTAGQKKAFFNLRRVRAEVLAQAPGLSGDELDAVLASKMDISVQDVRRAEQVLNGGDGSLDVPVRDGAAVTRGDLLVDDGPSVEAALVDASVGDSRMRLLRAAVERLPERERSIFVARRLSETAVTLEDLSQKYGISRERVRQIEVRAYERVQQHVRRAAAGAH